MGFKEHVARISPEDGLYHYQPRDIRVAIVPSQDSLQGVIEESLRAAFEVHGDHVFDLEGGRFTNDVGVGIFFTPSGDWFEERRPKESLGRFPKKDRAAKKMLEIQVLPREFIPLDQGSEGMSRFMREILVRKAVQGAVVLEGEEDNELKEGNCAFIGSMMGDVGQVTFEGDKEIFFGKIAETLELLAGAEMVNDKKDKVIVNFPTFGEWCEREAVQEIAYASRILGENGYLWDLNLREAWSGRKVSRRQVRNILYALGQAGLSEGNLSAVDRELKVMAITETGINKTKVEPLKGQVVAVAGVKENGPIYWVLRGVPKGHPINLLRRPTLTTAREVWEYLDSSVKIKKGLFPFLRYFLSGRDLRKIDKPPSIEAHENGALYMAAALWEAGRTSTFEDYLRYLAESFSRRKVLPVIPNGCEVGFDSAVHLHLTLKGDQSDSQVRVVDIDMTPFGYQHSPDCGSLEAELFLIYQLILAYQKYGVPESEEEIWGINIPGHGCCLLGRRGMRHLADAIALGRVKFEEKVKRSMDLHS